MFSDFKPVLKILLRFVLLYLALLGLYQVYLNGQLGLDGFSKFVAQNCTSLQNFLGYESVLVNDIPHETAWFFVSGRYIARMVEGCNAISVMILFLAFIFAFYKGAKTFVFSLLGVVLLYVMNVIRIVGLNIILVERPELGHIGHEYFFPAIIYGSVVALWLVWIKFFALKK